MPTFEPKREVRFAVVLYGGVSLAIYINGVVQELLRMVRSTAGDPAPGTTGEIYREIAEALGGARLAVDVISGTSAGGINGVFLAKALALDADLDTVRKLWIEEADIGKLLNDNGSMDRESMRGFRLQDPRRSLLNSQRMYVKLLDALAGMDTANPSRETPLIPDELDLFVTATDLNGLLTPIQLAGKTVFERNHRVSLHFEYRHGERNDFASAYTPFLAFSARCTSAFPVAFEPMTLAAIEPVLRQKGIQPDFDLWKVFYQTHEAGPNQTPFRDRPLADGGYLDNKPFGPAVEALVNRFTDLPVERKLVYIEPAPDDPELDCVSAAVPDALENAWAALSSLPRNETIREDLSRILERNRRVEDLRRLVTSRPATDTVERSGSAHLMYRQLRASAVINGLAGVLAGQAGVPHWRGDSLDQFLHEYDAGFRRRCVRHLKRRVDEVCTEIEGSGRAQLEPLIAALRESHRDLRTLRPDGAAEAYSGQCRAAFERSDTAISRALDAIEDPDLRERLRAAYRDFEDYDALTFPVMYHWDAGEPETVDVIRICPEDATSLVDERGERIRKLRGTAIGNFGGFLDAGWRKNDMLWGRLDGAERIICALLPGPEHEERRKALIARANDMIVREELGGEDHIRQALAVGPLTSRQIVDRHRAVLNERPNREEMAGWFTRGTAIMGAMLEAIAEERRISKRPFSWVARAGRVAWATVEVLSPRSLGDLFFRHFLKVAWLCGVLLAAAGIFIRSLRAPAWILLAWVAAIWVVTWLIRDWLAGKRRAGRLLGFLGGTLLVALLVTGAISAWDWLGRVIDRFLSFA